MSKTASLIPLSRILTKSNSWIDIKPTETYKQVTVKIWGKGVVERNEVTGAEISANTRLKVDAGQFILSRIDARHGAFGLIPESLAGAVVTNDFPVFSLNKSLIIPQFLNWISKTESFIELCKAASEGTTNRIRLKESKFLSMEISLPPLEEQRRIVGRIEELAGKIAEARGLRERSIEEAEVLKTRIYEIGWSQAVSYSDNWENLERYANVIDPQPDHRTPPEIDGGMPYVSIANISIAGKVDIIGSRKVSITAIERQEASFTLKTGDIVLGKIGTIGAARPIIVKDRFALSANVVLVQPDESKVMKEFILGLLRSPQMKEQFTEGTRKTAQEAFGIKKMRKLLIPVPSLPEQQRIVTYLDALQSNVDTAKRLRQESLKELDALLPAILDKAFKGEL
ncbi:restriction endonuclease subunit S [Chamaesiphon sp.]|uniref:restriction endonuclease subunit S n=1 Tax=Chamaesiphon sp. TaxID=2814140 RepID=UPI0035943AA2